jgi:hypothetical protein
MVQVLSHDGNSSSNLKALLPGTKKRHKTPQQSPILRAGHRGFGHVRAMRSEIKRGCRYNQAISIAVTPRQHYQVGTLPGHILAMHILCNNQKTYYTRSILSHTGVSPMQIGQEFTI